MHINKESEVEVVINNWAVLAAAVSSVVVGWVWYMPQVFGGVWMKLAKIDPKKGDMTTSMVSVLVSSLIKAYVLAHVIYLSHYFFQNSFLNDSLTTAFWVWLGFEGLNTFMHDQFNQRRKKESLIHMGNDLVTLMIMAAIIGSMGIK